MPVRAISKLASSPRAWQRLVQAQALLLPDAAWFYREIALNTTVDGTPQFDPTIYGGAGGYAAKLSTPSWNKRRDPDKWSTDVTHTLAVATDVEPRISDEILIVAPAMLGTSRQVRFRVHGQIVARRAGSQDVLIWHLQLEILKET
jgi:hypothetical protein